MPPLAPDQRPWRRRAPPVCLGHVRESGVLIGSGAQWPSKSILVRPPGARAGGSQPPPARSISGPAPEKSFAEYFVSAPAARPPKTGALDRILRIPDQGSRLSFDWIAPGFTDVCFWSARAFELRAGRPSWLGPRPAGMSRLTPKRCLAGSNPSYLTRN